jgi:pimeloyl-ACP methyl ester carboxylesterase
MAYIDNFYYQVYGPNGSKKLVFLHGLLGSGSNWRPVIGAFQDRFQILSFDQRGHGRSFHPPSGYAPEDYAMDLVRILDDLGWDRVDLVGHSMGGRNAMAVAALYPDRVDRLVIEDIGIRPRPAAAERVARWISMVPVPFADRAAAKNYFYGDFVAALKEQPSAMILAQFFFTNIATDSGVADWRFFKEGILESLAQGRDVDRTDQWRRITAPVLLVRGERSEDLTHEEWSEMLRLNPGAQGVEIPDAGHWVHFDQTERFVEALGAFLKP